MVNAWSPTWTPEPIRGRAMSIEDWSQLAEDEDGELVDGYLTEEEVPDPVHELAVTWLIALFRTWLRGRGGFVFGSEAKLRIDARRGRKADMVVYLPGGATPRRRGALDVAPDILVEIVTPTPRDERRDRVEKMDDYQSLGVRWYWLLDPALGSLEIFELGDAGKYIRVLATTEGRVEAVPGCSGLVLDIDELWADLSRLGPEV
jgi:Uma2 family endonuclease